VFQTDRCWQSCHKEVRIDILIFNDSIGKNTALVMEDVMPVLEWNDSFLIGIRQFDEHHKHLVLLLNMTFDGITTNAPKDELEAVLHELIEYTAYHFTAEEHWMKEHHYPGLDVQVKEHAEFTKRIGELAKDFHSGIKDIDLVVLDFLIDWLTEHILEKDSAYGTYVAAKGLPDGVDLSFA